MHRYMVKFEHQGRTIFGICDSFSDEAKAANRKGLAIVEDAVLPIRHEVEESRLVDIESGKFVKLEGKQGFGFDDEYHRYVQAEFEKAQALSDSLPDGVVKGKLFGVGVADGTAWYVVTKVNKKTCKVEWRSFCLDRYVDRWLGYGRTVPISDVAPYVCRAEALGRLFG